ncbi:MAG: 50S ribosomal protein L29 [Pirellulaceae bacterium]
MKARELRDMSDEQLQLTLKESCDHLFRLRIQSQTERLDAPSELRRHRRLIARIQTVQRERELTRVASPGAPSQAG